MDLVLGEDVRRVDFPMPLASAGELRRALVDLVKAGRALNSDNARSPM